MEKTYNSEKMIRMIIGKEWNEFSQSQKKQIHKVFLEYISLNYNKRFRKINEPNFQIDGKKKNRRKIFLCSNLTNN